MIGEDYQVLQTHFVNGWTGTIPVTYDLAPEIDRPDGAYVHFFVRSGSSVHYAGNRTVGVKRQLGRVWLNVFVPDGEGDGQALTLLDQFATLFRNWSSSDGKLFCRTEEIAGPSLHPNGMMMFSISVPFESLREY